MENKQQTAVEWLVKKISNEMIGEIPMHRWDEIRDVVQQAKAMEKQQIIDACLSNKTIPSGIKKLFEMQAEQYYTETYGKS
jgi:hypothetical protein